MGKDAESHQSWRGQPASSPGATPGKGNPWAWLATLVVILAILIWFLIPPDQIDAVVLTIDSDRSDLVSVPPLLFARHDLDDLTSVKSKLDVEDVDPHQSGVLGRLSRQIDEANRRQREVVILYVVAQGASLPDVDSADLQACLLYEDFDVTRMAAKSYAVAELLERLSKANAKVKLLILDWGNLVSDHRLGMLQNEFALLLEEDVQTCSGDVWVLTSHATGQASASLLAKRSMIFNRAVVAGLGGEADADGDHELTLAELFRYVNFRVGVMTDETQTPRIYRAGKKPSEIVAAELEATALLTVPTAWSDYWSGGEPAPEEQTAESVESSSDGSEAPAQRQGVGEDKQPQGDGEESSPAPKADEEDAGTPATTDSPQTENAESPDTS